MSATSACKQKLWFCFSHFFYDYTFIKKLLPAEQANIKGRTTSTTAFIISVYKVRDLEDIFSFIDIIALLFILCRSLKAMTVRDLNVIGYIGQVG